MENSLRLPEAHAMFPDVRGLLAVNPIKGYVGGAKDRGITTSAESKEFAKISAILDHKLGQLEAYLEGSANQLALGTDTDSTLQLEFGALARF